MRIPLNVLLYQLSANSIYENQNIDLTCSFDGVQLFDQTQLAGTYENELYLVADQVLLTALSRTSDQGFQSNCTQWGMGPAKLATPTLITLGLVSKRAWTAGETGARLWVLPL